VDQQEDHPADILQHQLLDQHRQQSPGTYTNVGQIEDEIRGFTDSVKDVSFHASQASVVGVSGFRALLRYQRRGWWSASCSASSPPRIHSWLLLWEQLRRIKEWQLIQQGNVNELAQIAESRLERTAHPLQGSSGGCRCLCLYCAVAIEKKEKLVIM